MVPYEIRNAPKVKASLMRKYHIISLPYSTLKGLLPPLHHLVSISAAGACAMSIVRFIGLFYRFLSTHPIEEKDEIIQNLKNKIQILESKIKTFENDNEYLVKSNTKSSKIIKQNKISLMNNSFLTTNSSANLQFGVKQNNQMTSNKNILFNVEVTNNLKEKHEKSIFSSSNNKLNNFSKNSSPKSIEKLIFRFI